MRRLIYTTNLIEAHRQFRKVTKSKNIFPTDESLTKMLDLATMEVTNVNIDEKLAVIWSSVVEDFSLDLANHQIELQIKTFHNSIEERKSLLINGVIGFLWVNDSTPDGRTNTEPWDYIDLASVYISRESEVIVRGQFNKYGLKPNLAFEIWGSVLLIEANNVIIDEKSFSLSLNA